jgi:feruloyl esterase
MERAIGAANAAAATRFYVAAGVNHCMGGAGPDQTDLLTALDQWVTHSIAPADLVARKLDADGAVIRAMPLCEHRRYPRYIGRKNDPAAARAASNYVCTASEDRSTP